MASPMMIADRTLQCASPRTRPRKVEKIDLIVIHRCDIAEDAVQTARVFIDDPAMKQYTGGMMPYTFYICKNGIIEQALPVGDLTPHARRWNARGLGVALSGDFREDRPTQAQMRALVMFCRMWSGMGIEQIKGHDELAGGSIDPDKSCPGRFLNMNQLRREVLDCREEHARTELVKTGVVF